VKRKILQRVVVGLACAVALSGLLYLILVISLADDPHGKYASYEFFPHHSLDIIRFENGKVRSETCCGDDDWGTYSKDASGQWVWRYQYHTDAWSGPPKPSPVHEFVIRRSLLGIEIRSETDPSLHLFMRRRLSNSHPF
jgi:hypothetical protein